LRSLGVEPLPHVVDETISEVDEDGSGVLNLEEFIQFMEIMNVSEGFTKSERAQLTSVHKRYDTSDGEEATMPTEALPDVLSWLGYHLLSDEAVAIGKDVDVDGSGSLDLHEFLMCMRKVREREIKALKRAIKEHDTDDSDSLSIDELEPLFKFSRIPG
jgi:Ca2+-binding EF-hand superfamily protein